MGLLGSILNLGVNVIKTPFAAAEDILSGSIIDPDEKLKTPKQIGKVLNGSVQILDDLIGSTEDEEETE